MVNLRQTLDIASKLLSQHQIDYALIGGFALGAHGIHRATQMTPEEYLDFLEQYWELFGPPPPRKPPVIYTDIKI